MSAAIKILKVLHQAHFAVPPSRQGALGLDLSNFLEMENSFENLFRSYGKILLLTGVHRARYNVSRLPPVGLESGVDQLIKFGL
jgi:hypothetical protein